MPGLSRHAIAAGWLWAGLFGQAGAQAIYSCVDAQGRRLTADRQIAECMDREQRELNPSGTIKRKLGPNLTAREREAHEAKIRKEAEESNRLAEEKRRERALLTRYPDRRTHDKERAAAIALVDQAIAVASKRAGELAASRERLATELEFYKDPSKVPAHLRRQIDENEQQIEAQQRFLANQDKEKQRISAQFDEELTKLTQLWTRHGATPHRR